MNMTEAAKALFISQPAVSKALIQFENTLQVKLFIRDKQNELVLTEVGKEMLSLARRMKEIEHKVEIGIVASPFNHYDVHILEHDSMVAIIPENHPLPAEHEVSLEKNRNDLIFCKGGHESAVLNTLHEQQIPFQESLTVQTAKTLVHMVQKKLDIGIISKFTLSSVSHSLIVKEIIPRITRDIGIIAHSFDEATPAAREFVKALGQLYRSSE
ncbi:LysR substrate-binding domain-containing protein [Paenibacillus sp. NPDC055715]